MTPIRVALLLKIILVAMIMIDLTIGRPPIEEDIKLTDLGNQLTEEEREIIDDMMLRYIFGKGRFAPVRNQELNDLQRKRSYWKLCAFNAVSCFGKK